MEMRRVEGSGNARGRLLRWEREGGGGGAGEEEGEDGEVWVDRYVSFLTAMGWNLGFEEEMVEGRCRCFDELSRTNERRRKEGKERASSLSPSLVVCCY